jgi:hypothetical protein
VRNGLTVMYDPGRSPITIDAESKRVLSIAWKSGDAWRMEIETYQAGRWQSRLKAAAHPRPWLERWRWLSRASGKIPSDANYHHQCKDQS